MDKTQEQAKHTPLPWKQHTGNGKTYAGVRGADDRCVVDCGSRFDDTAQANAALIVRACNCHDDLLKLAERTKNMLQTLIEDLGGIAGGPALSGLRKLRDEAEAAIAKVNNEPV